MSSPWGLILSSCESSAVIRHPVSQTVFSWICVGQKSLSMHGLSTGSSGFSCLLKKFCHATFPGSCASRAIFARPLQSFVSLPFHILCPLVAPYRCGYVAANKLLCSFPCMLHGILVVTGDQNYWQTTPSL